MKIKELKWHVITTLNKRELILISGNVGFKEIIIIEIKEIISVYQKGQRLIHEEDITVLNL